MNRAMLMTFAVAGYSLAAAGPASASRPPTQHPPGWTVYDDVIIEVASPRDVQTGQPGIR